MLNLIFHKVTPLSLKVKSINIGLILSLALNCYSVVLSDAVYPGYTATYLVHPGYTATFLVHPGYTATF